MNRTDKRTRIRGPRPLIREPGVVCDCGRAKEPRALACRQCLWLDGTNYGELAVVGELRYADGPIRAGTLAEQSGLTYEHVLRVLKRLAGRGRVIRFVDGTSAPFGANGHGVAPTYVLRDRRIKPRSHAAPGRARRAA